MIRLCMTSRRPFIGNPGRTMTFQLVAPKLADVGGVFTAEPLSVMTSWKLIFHLVDHVYGA
jgi:hypothetical protein